ncbi:hypothetical protein AAC387_Pa11g2154 [Persea americana]
MSTYFFRKRFKAPFNLLQRLGPTRSSQFRGYTGSPNHKWSDKQLHEAKKPLLSKSWISYAVPAALLVIAGGAMFVHHNDKKRAILKGSSQRTGSERNIRGLGPVIGGPFKLIDTDCNSVTDRDLRGNWTLIYFGYTSSPDVGPEEVKKMAKAIDILESEQNPNIKPVFISIDPERDSPSHLRAYLEEFDTRIIGLTGSISAIRQTAQEYRIYFKKFDEEGGDYLIETSHKMYLMNPDMELVRCFGVEYDAEQLCEEILNEVKGVASSDK